MDTLPKEQIEKEARRLIKKFKEKPGAAERFLRKLGFIDEKGRRVRLVKG